MKADQALSSYVSKPTVARSSYGSNWIRLVQLPTALRHLLWPPESQRVVRHGLAAVLDVDHVVVVQVAFESKL
jgi:hypothetical protein